MNKAELIDVLTQKIDVDRRVVAETVEQAIETIVRAVHRGDSVTISGFGVFEQRHRAPRKARNPRTGESVDVEATAVPLFRPSAQFKSVVSGEKSLGTGSELTFKRRSATCSSFRTRTAKKAAATRLTSAAATSAETHGIGN